ncbi:MAG: 30S ribosomal protein S6 [Clostridia bacterium]|nr:30S ribosomal protein S6 [Clostridia bacterium]
MNKYETIFIVSPDVAEEGMKGLIQKFSDIINNDGKVLNVEEMGKKRLAYEIKKNMDGYYIVINFEANPGLIKELERVYRITDDVIKFLTVSKEEK